jgi:hypothetical protein
MSMLSLGQWWTVVDSGGQWWTMVDNGGQWWTMVDNLMDMLDRICKVDMMDRI